MRMNMRKKQLIGAGIAAAILVSLVVPAFGWAGSHDQWYVNDDASGTQNGSASHPYKTIWQAINKASKGDTIFIRKGTYEENITIPKGVEIVGAGRNNVTIKADDKDDPTVVMKDGSKLQGVTVKNGRVGVYVRENAKASISDSDIINNKREGILIAKGERNDSEKVSVVDVYVGGNGKTGIYARKRKVILLDSDVKDNRGDGVFFEMGVRGWVDNNSISENKLSGMVLQLDNADTTIASKNTIRKNGREGIEVSTFGGSGYINIRKSRISENGRYGISRVQRTNVSSVWNGLSIEENNNFFGNVLGNVSSIFRAS